MSGTEYLETLRDGRTIYLGEEEVDDVTTHPGFRNAARSFADLYDVNRDPANRDLLTFEEDGSRYAMCWLRPRSRDDLDRRYQAHQHIADMTYGMMGRTPDFYAGFIVALAMTPEILDTDSHQFAANLLGYYERAREHDWFVCNALTPPAGTRKREVYLKRGMAMPALRVTAEDDKGVVLNGAKLLATSAPFSHWVWLGNVHPLDPDLAKEAITCVVPTGASGLSLWSRKSFEKHAVSEIDNPLAYRYDESDCIVVCEDVRVPWEDVFVHDDTELSVDIYLKTPAHSLGNHQATIRFVSKMKFFAGVARRIAQLMGTDRIPAVQDTLGHLAALEGMIEAMVQGQIHTHETLPGGYVNVNRRFMYSAVYWCYIYHEKVCAIIRELMGGGVMQLPADVGVLENPEMRERFEHYWSTPEYKAEDRFKLFKLAWDAVGTDFAGRHMLYEKFYVGPSFVLRGHCAREAPWGDMTGMIDDLLGKEQTP
ncbi:MAG: hypothetical protein GY791_12810 [Alphaproteobacteria bacterium]|nr:hypothetical protein [Alphaproteobacteria bacterium]